MGEQTAEGRPAPGRNWQKLAALAAWAALLGGLAAYILLSGQTLGQALRSLVGLMQTPYGPLIYLLAYALRPLTFFSATLLTLAAGAIFGPLWGVVYTVVASNVSASVAYLLGRFLGQGLLDGAGTGGFVQRYAERMRARSFETTLVMRCIFLPYDLVSYLAGFLRIGYRPFILATALGSLPGTLSFVLAGAAVRVDDLFAQRPRPALDPWVLGASAALFVASLALARFLRAREGPPAA